MTNYKIWKDGKIIEDGIIINDSKHPTIDYLKKQLKQLNGNVLHVINGDVISVYKNMNNRVRFSHTFTREDNNYE